MGQIVDARARAAQATTEEEQGKGVEREAGDGKKRIETRTGRARYHSDRFRTRGIGTCCRYSSIMIGIVTHSWKNTSGGCNRALAPTQHLSFVKKRAKSLDSQRNLSTTGEEGEKAEEGSGGKRRYHFEDFAHEDSGNFKLSRPGMADFISQQLQIMQQEQEKQAKESEQPKLMILKEFCNSQVAKPRYFNYANDMVKHDDIVAQSLDDEQTPRANQRQTEGRAPGKINSKHDASKTGKEVVPASVDNEAKPESGRVKQPLVPSSDNDMPVENAKKPKPRPKGHGAKQVTATGAKGQATFTTYDANATTALKGRSEKQITSDMEMDGGEKINDPKTPAKQGRKIDLIDDQGEPQAASKTKSKGAAQKAPGEKANQPEVNILDSEISIDESPVKAKKKRSKPSAEEAKKEMEGLKKQVKEAKTKKRADEADLNKSATSAPHKLLDLRQYVKTRTDSHEKTVNSEPDIPSFEEDQEVEHQAMLSSPLKGRQRITSKTLVTVKARQTGKAKEAVNVKNVPSGKPHSNQNASGSKFNAKKEPGSAEETADDLDDTSDSAFWKITILSAYRTHIACTKEIWTVQNTTLLRYLQTIWDFFAKDKQAYTFVPTDPIFSLLRQKMSDWRHKFADTALQALRSFLDEKEESEEESRQLVTELLVKKYYIYAEFDEDENGVISAVRPFCSQLVSQTFARHLIEINGKNYELPNLQPPDKPIAALALAAAAVERALTLYRDRHLVPCFKGGVKTFDIQGLSLKESAFSADHWSNTTAFFVRHLDLLPQSKWNKISNAAKVYLPQPCAARQARKGKAPIDEVEEDLQLNWRDDDD
ncbi:hypothetical protein JOM56_011719 [Amanita muscaria]